MTGIVAVILSLFACSTFAGNLDQAFAHSAAGMKTQSARMKVVAQNIANADSTGSTPGAEPYRRKTITVKSKLDPITGAQIVTVDNIGRDYESAFQARYEPNHPAANAEGYVLLPNVSTSTERLDMKESQRSYEANLSAIETTKRMYTNTIDLLR